MRTRSPDGLPSSDIKQEGNPSFQTAIHNPSVSFPISNRNNQIFYLSDEVLI